MAASWTDEESAVVAELYAQGWRAVHARLPHRGKAAIVSRAAVLGVQSETKSAVLQRRREPAWEVPAMTLVEQLDCLRLRKWAGPVDRERVLTWRIAA